MFSEDFYQYLLNNAFVTAAGIDYFSDIVPESPDNIVVLYEYGGDPVNPFTDVAHRSFQLMVRNVNPDTARQLALNIHKSLAKEDLIVYFTSTRFGQVHLRQTPYKLKMDENNRVIYCFNMGITTTID